MKARLKTDVVWVVDPGAVSVRRVAAVVKARRLAQARAFVQVLRAVKHLFTVGCRNVVLQMYTHWKSSLSICVTLSLTLRVVFLTPQL
jgi:hypothetical protein